MLVDVCREDFGSFIDRLQFGAVFPPFGATLPETNMGSPKGPFKDSNSMKTWLQYLGFHANLASLSLRGGRLYENSKKVLLQVPCSFPK